MLRLIIDYASTLLNEAGSLNQNQSLPVACFASQLSLEHLLFLPSEARFTGRPPQTPILPWILGIQTPVHT